MPMEFNPAELLTILPLIIVAVFAMAMLLMDVVASATANRAYAGYTTLLGLGVAFGLNLLQWGNAPVDAFFGLIAVDGYSVFFNAVLLGAAGLTVLLGQGYFGEHGHHKGEFYALVLMSLCGMMLMGMATDLLMFFVALELMSIPIYVLAGFNRHQNRSVEAALKYFLMGAFSTAFLLFGLAFVYGAVGGTGYDEIIAFIKSKELIANPAGQPLMLLGMSFVLVAFGFKIAAVPMHMWTPDAYQGAPTPVTAFMAAAVKAAAFAGFIRLFIDIFHPFRLGDFGWFNVIWVLAILTMTLGNLTALVQDNIKRMLAYSSIAHAGYLLIGFLTITRQADTNGSAALLFYLAAYAVMNMGAFGVVALFGRHGNENLEVSKGWAGFGFRAPAAAAAMTIFMLSLAGMPATAGFMGKFYIFKAAIDQGLIVIVILGVLNSLLSVYYYLRVIVYMYFVQPEEGAEAIPALNSMPLKLAVLFAAAGVLYLGILPGGILEAAQKAAASLF